MRLIPAAATTAAGLAEGEGAALVPGHVLELEVFGLEAALRDLAGRAQLVLLALPVPPLPRPLALGSLGGGGVVVVLRGEVDDVALGVLLPLEEAVAGGAGGVLGVDGGAGLGARALRAAMLLADGRLEVFFLPRVPFEQALPLRHVHGLVGRHVQQQRFQLGGRRRRRGLLRQGELLLLGVVAVVHVVVAPRLPLCRRHRGGGVAGFLPLPLRLGQPPLPLLRVLLLLQGRRR
mmetsp:Transcript_13482/g.40749  ORF Transcript_13482/g.40749 Transcript_13482/m.40749 type:complete len:234 (-) Transcript_13482:453-1154(-)